MPTDWQQRYESGDMPWEKGIHCPGLEDFLAESVVSGRVLVPGCGYGHDARALANSSGHPEVVGVDLAHAAIAGARSFPNPPNLTFVQGDFLASTDGPAGSWDWVWEHTLFCAIDPHERTRYAEAVAHALKPGGHFLAIFYLDPGHTEPGPPFGVPKQELDTRFGPAFELLREWVPARAYPGREGRELLRLHRKR